MYLEKKGVASQIRLATKTDWKTKVKNLLKWSIVSVVTEVKLITD